jgi:hypothetical protein
VCKTVALPIELPDFFVDSTGLEPVTLACKTSILPELN